MMMMMMMMMMTMMTMMMMMMMMMNPNHPQFAWQGGGTESNGLAGGNCHVNAGAAVISRPDICNSGFQVIEVHHLCKLRST